MSSGGSNSVREQPGTIPHGGCYQGFKGTLPQCCCTVVCSTCLLRIPKQKLMPTVGVIRGLRVHYPGAVVPGYVAHVH